jgi:glycosyltransferase involved in cell wall biosynthesis
VSKRILFISNHASFFCSHRINIYRESKKRNLEFKLIFGNSASKSMDFFAIRKLKKERVNYVKLNYSHNSINFFNDLKSIFLIRNIVSRYKPNIIHSASPKANLLASIMVKLIKIDTLVLSLSGLGYLFTNKKKNYLNILKANIFLKILKFCLKNQKKKIIVQNKDDFKFIRNSLDLKKKEIMLIRGGSGVENIFFKTFKKKSNKNIIMVSRIVANKGVKEFILAAEELKKKYSNWKFFIIGSKDYISPDNVDDNFLYQFERKGIVKIINYKSNVLKYLRNSEIFCLPSYREGMPKTVLEALSVGLPVVTTNSIGCKDSIINGFNGLLCRRYDYMDLSKKLEILIKNKNLRKRMSINAKKYAKKNFPIHNITNKIYKIYNS